MFYETIDLYDYFSVPRGGAEGGRLTAYCPEKYGDLSPKTRPAALIFPGGGYEMVSARESEPVALRFLGAGFGAFVLEYTVKTPYPVPLIEAAMAIKYLRGNAERYRIDPSHICTVGFSAGGHLVGMLATMFRDENIRGALGEKAEGVRPDAAVLCYPVILTAEKHTVENSNTARVISGGDSALREFLSIDRRVTAESAPAFIWHTGGDDFIPAENSLLLAEAYRKNGVPCELHVFEEGQHGLSVAGIETSPASCVPEIVRVAGWFDLAVSWLRRRGFLVRDGE